MWHQRAQTLPLLTKIRSTKVKFRWIEVVHNTYTKMMKVVGCDVLLYYPNFSERFIIQSDTINTHPRGVNSQNGKPIDFYSRKLTPPQINYMVREQKLFSIVETLKSFKLLF